VNLPRKALGDHNAADTSHAWVARWFAYCKVFVPLRASSEYPSAMSLYVEVTGRVSFASVPELSRKA
jgi:hypothetical protein